MTPRIEQRVKGIGYVEPQAECAACQREMPLSDLLETPLYFVCLDSFECQAHYSGWDTPAEEPNP